MKLHAFTFTMAMALAGFAGAAGAGQGAERMQPADTMELLSRATGLTVHEIELALGPSANYESPVKYESANRRFRQAVGRTLYEQIMGEGELSAREVGELVAMAKSREARQAASRAHVASK